MPTSEADTAGCVASSSTTRLPPKQDRKEGRRRRSPRDAAAAAAAAVGPVPAECIRRRGAGGGHSTPSLPCCGVPANVLETPLSVGLLWLRASGAEASSAGLTRVSAMLSAEPPRTLWSCPAAAMAAAGVALRAPG